MKNLIFLFCVLFSVNAFSQANILNASTPSEIGIKNFDQKQSDSDSFLEFDYIDERDILWSKIVYEKIDLNEKLNFPLLFPVNDETYEKNRKSLWRILREYIFEKTLSENGVGYGANSEVKDTLLIYDQQFRNFTRLDDGDRLRSIREELPDDQKNNLVLVDEVGKEDINGDGAIDDSDIGYLPSFHIIGYNLKGVWYFDKKYGELKYRLIAIQPVGYQSFEYLDAEEGSPLKKPASFFWIWYKDIREQLHKHYVFSDKNNSKRITFDQLLISRRFHTYLYRVDNIMDDRELSETPYINENPYLRITQSQRLKEIIRNFEHDMWSN
jgi:gliding motility associated protien GldN